METEQSNLVDRVRRLLADEPSRREVAMFGGRAFMVNEKMVASASKGGHLLVRVAAERHDELVAHAGAAQAEMGEGRSMGPGWVRVLAESIQSDEGLAFWLDVALEYNRSTSRS